MPKDILASQAEQRILILRDQKVMLDFHLAELDGVETRTLKQAVRRNPDRFPEDFMFGLTSEESQLLVSQTVIPGLGKRAGQVNIAIVRAFVRLRQLLASHAELAGKLDEMERKYDGQFRLVFDALRRLMTPPANPAGEMGYHTIPKPAPAKRKQTKAAKTKKS